MKDPHVDLLIYRIEHGPFVTYENAKPMQLELPDFRLRAEGAKVCFEMKGHYRTVGQARRAVEPFAKAWVLDVTFRKQRGWFGLEYENSQVIDLATGSTSQGVAIQVPNATLKVNPQSLEEFPTPPPDMLATPDVQSMFDRYVNSMNGREPLPSMAYFCVTVLKTSIGSNLRDAAKKLNVSQNVLKNLEGLSSRKGGDQARKADARECELSPEETRWMKLALRAVIKRSAEVSFDPAKQRPHITLSELPKLLP